MSHYLLLQDEESMRLAQEAGADIVGNEDIIDKVL